MNRTLVIALIIIALLATLFAMACIPPPSADCTPGFWKQPQHFQYWRGGYDPGDTYPGTGMTLLQALQGGYETRVSRFVVAGWLNAANPFAPCE